MVPCSPTPPQGEGGVPGLARGEQGGGDTASGLESGQEGSDITPCLGLQGGEEGEAGWGVEGLLDPAGQGDLGKVTLGRGVLWGWVTIERIVGMDCCVVRVDHTADSTVEVVVSSGLPEGDWM